MKHYIVGFIAVLVCISPLNAEDKPLSSATEAEKTQIRSINKRLNYGDKQSLAEVANMRPSIAIPFLASYTRDRSTDPERAEIARQTLAKIPGLEEYFLPILAVPPKEEFGRHGERMDAFRLLSRLKTKEAVRIIVTALFDESVPHCDHLPGDVIPAGPIKYATVEILKQMELPGAPNEKFTAYYEENSNAKLAAFRDAEVEKWRAWWTANKDKYQKE